jgi:zinc D-Ala-D-Ala carboxypeptidase
MRRPLPQTWRQCSPIFAPRADSRTMKGGGAAGVEVAQSVLTETQTAIPQLVPYLDTQRWVLIAVALGGIAVTI